MSFEGKVVLITGASSGIGAACAEYFAKEGALLALVGRNPDKFEKVVENLKENSIEVEPLIILADITVDAEKIISETIEKYGRLDILINNAGFIVTATFDDLKMEDYDTMMATNVRGVVELTKLAVPHLVETQGNIVNISSCTGTIPPTNGIAYSMSKAAINQFTKCLAIELASKGIRVNAISPGFITNTDFHTYLGVESGSDEFNAIAGVMATLHPIQRNGTTDDCVNAIAFLTKENASFVTGVNLRVDGGITIKGVL